MPRPMKDIARKRFGRLIAIEPTGVRHNGSMLWKCRCSCGRYCNITYHQLTQNRTRSCGCLRTERVKESCGAIDGTRLSYLDAATRSDNTTGIKGVSYHKQARRWQAEITFQGHKRYLGLYATKEEAAAARRKAEQELFDPMLENNGRLPTRKTCEEEGIKAHQGSKYTVEEGVLS